jgi:hypothetical protein
MRNVLVVGYPKSGNTWLTRLVAELLVCPVQGFWGQPDNPELAVEGQDRCSDFRVYKGHQTFQEIEGQISEQNIVYIVRDVRDVVISGAHYFQFMPKGPITSFVKRFPRLNYYYRRIFRPREPYRITRMIEIVDKGDATTSWCKIPWDQHVQSYLDQNILFVRYKDLLSTPLLVCQKILSQLKVNRTAEEIGAAIERQSFDVVKRKFAEQGDLKKERFLREGRSDSWQSKLTEPQKEFLARRFAVKLGELGYV